MCFCLLWTSHREESRGRVFCNKIALKPRFQKTENIKTDANVWRICSLRSRNFIRQFETLRDGVWIANLQISRGIWLTIWARNVVASSLISHCMRAYLQATFGHTHWHYVNCSPRELELFTAWNIRWRLPCYPQRVDSCWNMGCITRRVESPQHSVSWREDILGGSPVCRCWVQPSLLPFALFNNPLLAAAQLFH